MKSHITIALAVAGIVLAGQALAASIDMSKVACKDVGAMPPARIVGVAMWVNGYAHGKAGDPMIDGEKAHANAAKVAAYCKKNPSSTLMDALDAIAKP